MASADDSDSVILDANSSQILKKLLACSACKAYPKGEVKFCGLGHNVCSLCYTVEEDECPVDDCEDELMPKRCIKTDFADMVCSMKLLVPCKNRKNGCTDQHIMEKIEEHESECEHRRITGWVSGLDWNLFKDFAAKLDTDYINEQKWHFKGKLEDGEDTYGGVFKFFIGPDQRRFCVDIGKITDRFVPFYIYVVGGKEVAKKYKAELRIYSPMKRTFLSFIYPVFPVDNPMPDGEAFYMNPEWFETFNNGFNYFGNHNKDKNGEIVIPVWYKIIK